MSIDMYVYPTKNVTISWEELLTLWRSVLYPMDQDLLGESSTLIEWNEGHASEADKIEREGVYSFRTLVPISSGLACFLKSGGLLDERTEEERLSSYWSHNETSDTLQEAAAKCAHSDCYYSITSYFGGYRILYQMTLCWAIATACEGYIVCDQDLEELPFGAYTSEKLLPTIYSIMQEVPEPTRYHRDFEIYLPSEVSEQDAVAALWTRCLKFMGAELDTPFAHRHFDTIVGHYAHPDRHYHNLAHLVAMIRFLAPFNYRMKRPAELCLAVLFHDVIYDSRAKDNEEQSAELARKMLEDLNLPNESIERITSLILSTRDHQPKMQSIDNFLLLDADLSILAAEQKEYRNYVIAIRREYSWVSDEDYRRGRAEVLKKFLARKRIYLCVENHRSLDLRARENMSREWI